MEQMHPKMHQWCIKKSKGPLEFMIVKGDKCQILVCLGTVEDTKNCARQTIGKAKSTGQLTNNRRQRKTGDRHANVHFSFES